VPDGTPADMGYLSVPLLFFFCSFTQTETSFSLNKEKMKRRFFKNLFFIFQKGRLGFDKIKKNDVSFFNLFFSLFFSLF